MPSKLIRDKIPEIIRQTGINPNIYTANNQEYSRRLIKKLLEETKEYLTSRDTEELADIIEVIYAIANDKGITINELEKIRIDKYNRKGGFEKKIILIE